MPRRIFYDGAFGIMNQAPESAYFIAGARCKHTFLWLVCWRVDNASGINNSEHMPSRAVTENVYPTSSVQVCSSSTAINGNGCTQDFGHVVVGINWSGASLQRTHVMPTWKDNAYLLIWSRESRAAVVQTNNSVQAAHLARGNSWHFSAHTDCSERFCFCLSIQRLAPKGLTKITRAQDSPLIKNRCY